MVGVSNFRHAQYDAQGVGIDDPQTSLSSVRQDPTTDGRWWAGETLAQKNAKRLRVNAAIAAYCASRPNCHFIDQYAALVNPTDTSGYSRTAFSETLPTTGLHSTAAGCRMIGQLIANIITATVADAFPHVSSTIDSFDTDPASTNRASNPLMLLPLAVGGGAGVSQGAGTTITGNIATSWTVATVAGTATVACSTPARTVANDGDDY
jgi:hypothetical protein